MNRTDPGAKYVHGMFNIYGSDKFVFLWAILTNAIEFLGCGRRHWSSVGQVESHRKRRRLNEISRVESGAACIKQN